MKHYLIETEENFYVENLEEVLKRRQVLIEYREDQWMINEYEAKGKLREELNQIIKKFVERKVVAIWNIIKNIPPTDETKVRTYTRQLNKIKEYCSEQTLEDVLEQLQYYPHRFKDSKNLPEDYKPF